MKISNVMALTLVGTLLSIPAHAVVADKYLSTKNAPQSVCFISYNQSSTGTQPDSGCTGTLIRSNRILTAAHCLDNFKHGMTAEVECGGRSFRVDGYEGDPEYNDSKDEWNHIHDVAILDIGNKNDPKKKNYVTPMPLAESTELMNEALLDPNQCAIYGYGRNDNKEKGPMTQNGFQIWGVLRIATIQYVDSGGSIFKKGWKDDQTKIYSGPDVHAGHGDSGGPILCKMPDGSPIQVAVTTLSDPTTLVSELNGKKHSIDEYFSAHESIPFNLNWINHTADLPALLNKL